MNYKVEVEIVNQGEVHIHQIYDDDISSITHQMFDITEGVKEEAVKQALINLGWTPPKDTNGNTTQSNNR